MSNLYYYLNDQTSFYYTVDGSRIIGGDVVKITMPNNNISQSVFSLVDDQSTNYYTLNSIYISLSFDPRLGKYQLILQGYKNDYANNTAEQILIMIPILTRPSETINKGDNPIVQLNNIYIRNIVNNMGYEGTYNFSYGETEDSVDMNKFFTNNTDAFYFSNIVDANIKTQVVLFSKSNIYAAIADNGLLQSLTNRPDSTKLTSIAPIPIKVENNGMPITSTTETDIYIDCSPTDNVGQPVDIYTSKDMDQLKLFKINDLKVWAFRFVTIFIILLIIFVIIKIFQVTINGKTDIKHIGAATSGMPT